MNRPGTILLTLALFCTIYPDSATYAFTQNSIELSPHLVNQYELRNQTWAISQNPENHLVYVANSEGLIEYNGIRWEKHALTENIPLRSVGVHPSGKIFTGAFEELGYWQYDEKHELVYHSLKDHTDIEKNDEIWKIYFQDDRVYFQSFTSIYIYDFQTIKKVKPHWTMLFMHQLDQRFMVQIINNGLYWLENDVFIPIENSDLFLDKKVHAIVRYGAEKWLLCTEKDGLYLFDGKNFEYFQSEASDFLEHYSCNAARQINDSIFAFGSILNGLIITDAQGNIQQEYNTDTGLNNNTILSLYLDADGGLWTGLDVGINYINLRSPFTHYKSRNGALGTIYTLLKDGNQLYIGTNHGLFQADIVKKAHIYFFHNLRFIPKSAGQVWTLEKIEGQIICGHNEGTYLLKNGRLQQISTVTGGWTYKPFGNYLFGGTYTGIIVLEKNQAGEWQYRNKMAAFSEPTRYLETDYLGYIWASHHQKGIFQLEPSGDLMSAKNVRYFPGLQGRSHNIKAFKINNRVVFATSEDIFTFDFVRNDISNFNLLTDHLGEFRSASHILQHKNNFYWFITNDKLGLFEVGIDFSARKIWEIFHDNIHLPQRSIQIAILDDQTILIPNPSSFDAYNLNLGQENEGTSRLHIEKMLFYGQKDSLTISGDFNRISTPYNRNNITVYFADPSNFEQSNKVFQYRITELDPSWQNTVKNHFTYLDIKQGNYTLEIRQKEGDAIQLFITVDKPWYKTHLALLSYLMLMIAAIWGIVLVFRFEVSRHKELISMEMKQNTLQNELDYKSYELMLTMRHLIMKDDILTDLQKQINAIREQSSKYPVRYISNMERIIERGLGSSNEDWENTIKNLKLSQQGFFKFLKEKFPELTPNDLRLCSYLRLNFNTKEIAHLLNISNRSVETSRHRLRKKMKLGKRQNLTEFLISLDWDNAQDE